MTSIVPYTKAVLGELVSLYNEVTKPVPHCWPVSARTFHSMRWSLDTDGPGSGKLEQQEILVAIREGKAAGFLHAGVEPPSAEIAAERGIVRFLCFPRGRAQVGMDLLTAAEDGFKSKGIDCVVAFHEDHRLPFYALRYCCLSQRMDHIGEVFRDRGYGVCAGEVVLDRMDLSPDPPEERPSACVICEFRKGRGALPGIKLTARIDGNVAGHFESHSCGGLTEAPEAEDWAFITWIGVFAEHRRKGLGRYLLQRGLWEMRQAGYKHVFISAARENRIALEWYSRAGFRVVDRTVALQLQLQRT